MKLIDVHSHLDCDRLKDNLDKIVSKFKEVGGECIITSGINPSTNRKILEIAKRYPEVVKISFGIYPIDAIMKETKDAGEEKSLRYVEGFDVDEELNWIRENRNKCVAIGECGLDYKVVEGFNEEQKRVFQKVINLAKELDLPLVVHSRKAEIDAIEMMEKSNCKKVLMHCFNGKKSLIRKCVELGWSFSVPAVITRLEHFKMLVEMVPLKQLLTETDAPFLSPVAGEINEPANVSVTIREIAKIKNLNEEEVANQIFENYEKLFG